MTITERRDALIKRMATALYQFSTTYSGATWYDKRPGLRKPCPSGVSWRSCGAFRSWAIHAHDGVVAFCMDGYEHRSGHDTGSIHIASGGPFIFPFDDSRSHHSLRMTVGNGGELIHVTNEESVDWEPRISVMADNLEFAYKQLAYAIDEYDRLELERKRQDRERRIEAARSALSLCGTEDTP